MSNITYIRRNAVILNSVSWPSSAKKLYIASKNRIGAPNPGATSAPSRITTAPRIIVAIGQPCASKPSNGVQPQRG